MSPVKVRLIFPCLSDGILRRYNLKLMLPASIMCHYAGNSFTAWAGLRSL